jgi:predicted nuclease with TOPRIM domain
MEKGMSKELSMLQRELSKDNGVDLSSARAKISSVSNAITGLETELEQLRPGNGLAEKIAKMELRNSELEQALKIKESAIEKLANRNAQLVKELKAKDILRMSQLELLALRNCELETEIARTASTCHNEEVMN